MTKFYFLAIGLTFNILFATAQSFRINEVMTSNSGAIADSDGDTPDWIEFYNSAATSVNLTGYGLSDKKDDPFQWVFPNSIVNPGEYLLVFASGKDRRETPLNWNTIISSGDNWKYLVPTTEPTSNWRVNTFPDTNWLTGKSGFGFGDNDDATEVTVLRSIFLRKKFTISDVASVQKLVLHMDYDDGFIAYLNGVEIARSQMNGVLPRFDVFASAGHEALIYQGSPPEKFEISNLASVLKTGENILAIQVHNSSLGSSDLSAIPFLSVATTEKPTNIRKIDILKLTENELHTNFKMNADGESIYLTNPSSVLTDSIRIGMLPLNASYGRSAKNQNVWAIFTEPTPKSENLGTEYSGESAGIPIFSAPGMVYSSTLKVKLTSSNLSDSIFYTLNGSVPSRKSPVYKKELTVAKSTVIKARIFKTGYLPGETITNSYIMYRTNLPVVSLSLDSLDLWDYNTGIYVLGPNASTQNPNFGANFWEDWEKPCHFELMETSGKKVIDVNAGVKIFGNWSRANAQKSMQVHCRKKYGADLMKYKIFNNRPFGEFHSIVLRNSGNDWNTTMFRDGLMTSLTIGLHFEQMAYRPSAIFLNGAYWGLLNLREKIDENFLASNRGVNPNDVILLENDGTPLIGIADDWWKMYNFLDQNSMTVQANYDQVASQIDIESFTDYYASQVFYANGDWPGNNLRYWKTTDPASKWRWIMYDTDFGMGIWGTQASYNTLADATTPTGTQWYNPPWSTLIIRKLLENNAFRNQFVNRFADLMNSTFLSEQVNKAIDEKRDMISYEITSHLQRWNAGTQATWLNNVEVMKTFASARPGYVFGHISKKFGFQPQEIITVNSDATAGTIQLNSLNLNSFPWKGAYFPNVPITLTAVPNAGYRFLKWVGVTSNSNQPTITTSPKASLELTAIFENDGSDYGNIVINEISFNNNALPDPGDWVEIYNKGIDDIDVSGWVLTDSDTTHRFVFAPNTWIKANEYLVVSNDLVKMNEVFGAVKKVIGPFSFGLGNETDAVRLYSQFQQLIDEVSYSNVVPWKTFDLTKLWSLELINPANNNNLPASWVFSVNKGTPGGRNTPNIPAAILELPVAQNTTELIQNYPNPFNEGTTLEFKLDKPGKYSISVLDVNGRILRTLNDEDQLSSIHNLYWDGRDNAGKPVVSGVYFYRLECKGFSQTKRMVKM
jgi:hypothetical protein